MSHAELIRRLQALPAAQQAAVADPVEFLANRHAPTEVAPPAAGPLSQSQLVVWLDKPFKVPGFVPMSREVANAR
ncbi:MAG: hypothetical protein ABIR94_22225 [Rubrivivax sp.]